MLTKKARVETVKVGYEDRGCENDQQQVTD
jgi:hypothetical protein